MYGLLRAAVPAATAPAPAFAAFFLAAIALLSSACLVLTLPGAGKRKLKGSAGPVALDLHRLLEGAAVLPRDGVGGDRAGGREGDLVAAGRRGLGARGGHL